MLEALRKIIEGENQVFESVSYALFEGDRNFISAIELRFASLVFNVRAVADDDTLSINLGGLQLDSSESLLEPEKSDLWSSCIGKHIVWGWRLTNQQGYDDGLRLEFSTTENKFGPVVEFVVLASAIHIYSSARNEIV
jgi:hypothetical protein